MDSNQPHGQTAEPASLPGSDRPDPATYLIDWRTSLRLAERACCCSARPSVVAIVPPASDRLAPSDLLLCRHHYRTSERALIDAAIPVVNSEGEPLTPHTRALMAPATPAAAAAAGPDTAG
jgi:hypothetical protein